MTFYEKRNKDDTKKVEDILYSCVKNHIIKYYTQEQSMDSYDLSTHWYFAELKKNLN